MNKPLITTAGTNKMMKVSAFVYAIAAVLFAIFIYNFFSNQIASYPKYAQEIYLQEAAGLIIFEVIICGFMLIYAAYLWATCRSYVNVYEDRLEGKGIQNVYQIVDFSLSYDKITNVTCTSMYIYIHTPGGKYKIVSNVQTAKEVFNYYNTGR